jgi:hypothetical protein
MGCILVRYVHIPLKTEIYQVKCNDCQFFVDEKKKETRRELKTNYFVRKLCGTTSDAENKGVTGFEGRVDDLCLGELPEE